MNNFKLNGRVGQTLAGMALTVTIAFTGNMLVMPHTTHAATMVRTSIDNSANNSDTTNNEATTNNDSASIADDIIATGKQFLGVPYHFGAQEGRTSAFDCSSFTQYVFKENGIDIPRSSRQQAKIGKAVSKSDLQPGDLVFSDTNHDGVINHVSLYIGDGKLLHTYKVGIGVTVSEFKGSAWDRSFVTARRVLPDAGQSGDNGSQSDPSNGNNGDTQTNDGQQNENADSGNQANQDDSN